jgi:MFS family permease
MLIDRTCNRNGLVSEWHSHRTGTGYVMISLNCTTPLTWPGPFVGGIIVTFRSWRDIFWLQTALAGAGALLCFFLQPETIHKRRAVELEGLPRKEKAKKMWQWLNPWRVVALYRYPNLFLTVCVYVRPFHMLAKLTHIEGTCIFFPRLEHVLSSNAHPLRPQPALPTHLALAIWTLLHRTGVWLPSRHLFRRTLRRSRCQEVHSKTRSPRS